MSSHAQPGASVADAAPRLRVLFIMRSAGFLRSFDNALRALASRGHAVTIAIERGDVSEATNGKLREDLTAAGLTFAAAPARRRESRHRAATQVRLALDYLRYLGPFYDSSPKLRARAATAVLPPLRPLVRHASREGRASARALRRALHLLEQTAPVSPSVEAFLDEHPCDVIIVTPLVELGAPQTDWLRAARRRRIPSALAVASWDNLTVKGRIRESPDRVIVWNEPQRAEATHLHGIAPERVVVTGAHAYDHWFSWAPARNRGGFCAELGLRADRPIVLYVCSSPFIAPDEVGHVRNWIEQLRRSTHCDVRGVGVLVRPHPQHAAQWSRSDITALEQVSVWPRGGADPVSRQARDDFYDSIYHAAVVVGVNTSAMIECVIAGRRVLTLLTDRFAPTQSGTPHFAHLADPERGILGVASSVAEHHTQLAAAIAGEDVEWEGRRTRFLDLFVRPRGLAAQAAPRLADAIQDLHRRGPSPVLEAHDPAAPANRAAARVAAATAWRWAPLRTVSFAADAWGRRRSRREPLTAAQARVAPDDAARPPTQYSDPRPPKGRPQAMRHQSTSPTEEPRTIGPLERQ